MFNNKWHEWFRLQTTKWSFQNAYLSGSKMNQKIVHSDQTVFQQIKYDFSPNERFRRMIVSDDCEEKKDLFLILLW